MDSLLICLFTHSKTGLTNSSNTPHMLNCIIFPSANASPEYGTRRFGKAERPAPPLSPDSGQRRSSLRVPPLAKRLHELSNNLNNRTIRTNKPSHGERTYCGCLVLRSFSLNHFCAAERRFRAFRGLKTCNGVFYHGNTRGPAFAGHGRGLRKIPEGQSTPARPPSKQSNNQTSL